ADREETLLGHAEKPVTVRATVTRSENDVDSATADVKFVAPTSGAPVLHVSADPAAAVADGVSVVHVSVSARRLAAGTHVTLASSAGALSVNDLVLDDDGAGGAGGAADLT